MNLNSQARIADKINNETSPGIGKQHDSLWRIA